MARGRRALPAVRHPYLLPAADRRTPLSRRPRLDGAARPGRRAAWRGSGRSRCSTASGGLQEEYVEWRTVRERGGAISRVELTTELRDYWRVLAAHEPDRTVDLVGELTGRAVAPEDVYGIRAPAALDPAERGRAFAATMLASAIR